MAFTHKTALNPASDVDSTHEHAPLILLGLLIVSYFLLFAVRTLAHGNGQGAKYQNTQGQSAESPIKNETAARPSPRAHRMLLTLLSVQWWRPSRWVNAFHSSTFTKLSEDLRTARSPNTNGLLPTSPPASAGAGVATAAELIYSIAVLAARSLRCSSVVKNRA